MLLFFHRHLARHHHVAAAAIQLDDLDRNVLAEQRIQIVRGAHVDLRAGHERGNAHVHREPAFDAARHAAGYHQTVAMRFLQVLPGPQPAGLLVRQQDVTFRLQPLPVHHHVDLIAHLHVNAAVGLSELLDRN